MKLVRKIFFDTDNSNMGHYSVYEKRNGNTYITFFIEEKFSCFREYDSANKLIDGVRKLGFKMKNQQAYEREVFIS